MDLQYHVPAHKLPHAQSAPGEHCFQNTSIFRQFFMGPDIMVCAVGQRQADQNHHHGKGVLERLDSGKNRGVDQITGMGAFASDPDAECP